MLNNIIGRFVFSKIIVININKSYKKNVLYNIRTRSRVGDFPMIFYILYVYTIYYYRRLYKIIRLLFKTFFSALLQLLLVKFIIIILYPPVHKIRVKRGIATTAGTTSSWKRSSYISQYIPTQVLIAS